MNYEETLQKVMGIVTDMLGLCEDEATPDNNIVDHYGADELDCVEIIMRIERDFSMSIPDEDCEKLTTIEEITQYILKNRN